jgi:hypothetical protein
VRRLVLVDADDHVLAAVDTRLLARRGLFDAQLGHAGLDRLGHATGVLDLRDQFARLVGDLPGQRLHEIGTAPGIDDPRDTGFLLEDELRIARDARRELRGKCNRLVQGIRVQRLGPTEHRRHGLDRGAHDVVVGILCGQ